jgi:hypothetical protein
MKKILTAILFLIPFHAFCQIYNNPFLSVSTDASVNPEKQLYIGTGLSLSSNAITARLFSADAQGGFIDDKTKNSVLPALRDMNTYGGYQDNNVFYSWHTKKENTWYYLNGDLRGSYGAKFTGDLYKLGFFGNKDFAGRSAVLDGLKADQQSYESVQFGFFRYFEPKNGRNIVWGGGVSLLGGRGYTHITIPKGSFYTAPAGDSIVLDANIHSEIVNGQTNIIGLNGLGAAINTFFACRFANNNILRFQVSDFGLMYWFNHTGFDVNQKFTFTGADINANNGQFTISDYNLFFDSLAKRYNGEFNNGAMLKFLPFQVRVMYTENLSKSLSLTEALEYFNDNIHLPELSISASNQFSKKISARLGFSLLGYGNFGVTAGAEINVFKNVWLTIGSQHFEGLLFPDAHGEGYYAGLKWNL